MAPCLKVRLDGEPELDDVTVDDDVLLAFQPVDPGRLGVLDPVVLDIVGEGDDFRSNEAALEIAVNRAGCLGGRLATLDRPGAHLFLSGGEITDRAGCAIGRGDQLVTVKLLHTVLSEKISALLLRKLQDIQFVARRQDDNVLF